MNPVDRAMLLGALIGLAFGFAAGLYVAAFTEDRRHG